MPSPRIKIPSIRIKDIIVVSVKSDEVVKIGEAFQNAKLGPRMKPEERSLMVGRLLTAIHTLMKKARKVHLANDKKLPNLNDITRLSTDEFIFILKNPLL